jgi:restriction endonuclease S subunit
MTPHSHASGVVKGVRSTPLNKKIPLPPLEVQQAIVAEIEKERALVEASRQLAAAMQNKIKAVVEKVWQA